MAAKALLLRALRLRLRVLQAFKCDLPPDVRRIFPVADFLNRLVAARLVFCLGMVFLSQGTGREPRPF